MEVEKIIQKILLHELELPEDYGQGSQGFIIPSVYIFAPNISLGKTQNLQICIQSIGSKVIANQSHSKIIDGVFTEIKECVCNDLIQIDIMSRNSEARMRRFEVLTALNSVFSKEMQSKYFIRIFEIPSDLRNNNQIEASARIYRYTFTFTVQHLKQYRKTVDYYDKFKVNEYTDNLSNKNVII